MIKNNFQYLGESPEITYNIINLILYGMLVSSALRDKREKMNMRIRNYFSS